MRACCPFHNEKTPSFFVSPDRGSFYCFGCSKGGDIFTFVQEIEGVDFKEALKILADKAGVDLSKYKSSVNSQSLNTDENNILYEILEKATLFFENHLSKNESVKKYLLDRGLEEKIIKNFRIGFALDEWQALYDYLKKENYNDEQIIKSGLVVKNDKGRIYDRFRGRVIFPIFDERGRTIAYSARILSNDKDQPKYINSPETSLFNKSKTLYGLNFAKHNIRKYDFAILVEGQMDVIMAHQIGYANAIASSGTSFTEEQLKIIKRHTNNLLIAFDGDSAGINSSKKVWELALNNDMDVKILPLKEGEDPADVILKNSEEWKKLVKSSIHIIEHVAENIKNNFSDIRKQQKEAQIQIYPYIKSLKSYTDKSYFVEKISESFGIDRDAIWADINSGEASGQSESKIENKKTENINPREILYGIYSLSVIPAKAGTHSLKNPEEFLSKIKVYFSGDLISEIEKRKDKVLFKTENLLDQYNDKEKLANDMFSILKIGALEKRKTEINQKLQNSKEGSYEEKKLMRESADISRKLEDVKKNGCQDLVGVI